MPFLMIRNDIAKVAADAIVNPANRNLLQGSGTSRAIYQAAGEQELTAACEAIGHCEPGRAVCTPAFGLPAKYIFHAVCPAWHGGGFGEAEQLAGAYHLTERVCRREHFVQCSMKCGSGAVNIPMPVTAGCSAGGCTQKIRIPMAVSVTARRCGWRRQAGCLIRWTKRWRWQR